MPCSLSKYRAPFFNELPAAAPTPKHGAHCPCFLPAKLPAKANFTKRQILSLVTFPRKGSPLFPASIKAAVKAALRTEKFRRRPSHLSVRPGFFLKRPLRLSEATSAACYSVKVN